MSHLLFFACENGQSGCDDNDGDDADEGFSFDDGGDHSRKNQQQHTAITLSLTIANVSAIITDIPKPHQAELAALKRMEQAQPECGLITGGEGEGGAFRAGFEEFRGFIGVL